jgi:hypothetical protein
MVVYRKPGHSPKPRTLTKVGNLEGDLGMTVARFSSKFLRMPNVLGNTEIYAYFTGRRPPYLITISKGIMGPHPKYGYNIIFRVTSEFGDRNKRIADEFERQTEIVLRELTELRDAPSFVRGTLTMGEIMVFAKCREFDQKGKDFLKSVQLGQTH